MSSTIQLLITSDDFGMSHAVNQGILTGFRQGPLQSTNIMVPCPWAKHAAELSIQHNLAVGIHLTLTCEWDLYQWRSLTGAPSLSNSQYKLPASISELCQEAQDEDILKEFQAQLELLVSWGVQVTHIDTHMVPSCPQGPDERRIHALATQFAQEQGLLYTYATQDNSTQYFDSEIRLSEINSVEVAYEKLTQLSPGIHHLICHCAQETPEQLAIAPDNPWSFTKRDQDLRFLQSLRFQQIIKERQIELINIETVSKARGCKF